MEQIFNNIVDANDNLEEIFDGIPNKYLQDYYAIFIAAMAFNNYITLDPTFAAKLYVNILNSSLKDPDDVLNHVNEFLINKSIDDLEKELNNGN